MRKSFLIITVIFSFALRCSAQEVINADCNSSWGPGRYNKITISISFPRVKGFARFTQDFPVGFEILKDEVPYGDFSVNETRLNVVWMEIPEINQAEFSYFVKPENNMNGSFDMDGTLTIISDKSERQVIAMNVKTISVEGTNGLYYDEMKTKSGSEIVPNIAKPPVPGSNTKAGIVFRIQVSTSLTQIPEEKLKRDLGLEADIKLTAIKTKNGYKYQVGEYNDYNSANNLLRSLKERGLRDSFIVAYQGSEQITLDRAKGIR
jgi:hypothetical protein